MKNKNILLAAAFLTLVTQQQTQAQPDTTSKYARTNPFTVNYQGGRTHMTSYLSDPNTSTKLVSSIEQTCQPSKTYDFETRGFGPEISRFYFSNSQYNDYQVIVLVSIPLQKLFVLDRRVAANNNGNGLVYAWKTSTGYHDKHYGYNNRTQSVAYGQKGTVQIYHRNRESALGKLKSIAKNAGAHLNQTDGRYFITFDNNPTKKVEYTEGTTKITRQRAAEQGVEVLQEDSSNPNLVVVKRYVLNYDDYFHSEPGQYIVQNGFSSKHISGESDGALDSEEPYMPWAMFFNLKRGMATHGAAYRGTLGTTGSHGCIRLLEENACRLFHLVGQTEKTPKGHRAMYIVSAELGSVETRYMSVLQPTP